MNTKERILRAAVLTLATKGYAKTTARSIAAAGGFAPGVIYYHYADLDDLFVATAQFTSAARLARYRTMTEGVTSAVEMVDRLRALYAEDAQDGHIAAVQELIAAATASTRLAEVIKAETAAWVDYAETVLNGLLGPFAQMVPVREVATGAVATYLGLEMLSHLDAEMVAPDGMFAAAAQMAVLLDMVKST